MVYEKWWYLQIHRIRRRSKGSSFSTIVELLQFKDSVVFAIINRCQRAEHYQHALKWSSEDWRIAKEFQKLSLCLHILSAIARKLFHVLPPVSIGSLSCSQQADKGRKQCVVCWWTLSEARLTKGMFPSVYTADSSSGGWRGWRILCCLTLTKYVFMLKRQGTTLIRECRLYTVLLNTIVSITRSCSWMNLFGILCNRCGVGEERQKS